MLCVWLLDAVKNGIDLLPTGRCPVSKKSADRVSQMRPMPRDALAQARPVSCWRRPSSGGLSFHANRDLTPSWGLNGEDAGVMAYRCVPDTQGHLAVQPGWDNDGEIQGFRGTQTRVFLGTGGLCSA